MNEQEAFMSEYIEQFLDFLDESCQTLRMETTNLSEANNDLCDIEHYIELETPGACTMSKIYKLFKQTRCKRRQAKNNIELITPISEWVRTNEKAVRELREVLGTVRKVERLQSMRAYAVRGHILDDVTRKSHFSKNGDVG